MPRYAFDIAPGDAFDPRDLQAFLQQPEWAGATLEAGRKPKGAWHATVTWQGDVSVGALFDRAHALGEAAGGAAVPLEEPAPAQGARGDGWHRAATRFPDAGGPTTGAGVVVGHLDTGYTRHPELELTGGRYRVDRGFDLLDDDPDTSAAEGTRFYAHGTGTSSVLMSGASASVTPGVWGAAPGATLIPFRVAPSPVIWKASYRKAVAAGIHAAIAARAQVISISLGWFFGHDDLAAAVEAAEAAGVIVVAAAGQLNRYIPCPEAVAYPARYPSVVAVAASKKGKAPCPWSGHGEDILITAPGQDILRANWKDTEAAVEPSWGTSYATALTAGSAALWLHKWGASPALQDPAARPGLFRAALADSAEPIPSDTRGHWGAGHLDVARLLALDPATLTPRLPAARAASPLSDLSKGLADVLPLPAPPAAVRAMLEQSFQIADLGAFIEAFGQEVVWQLAAAKPDPVVLRAHLDGALAPTELQGLIPKAPLIPHPSAALAALQRQP